MKMKHHKIRGVDLNVCTAEQKIAYNLAFRAHITFEETYKKAFAVSAICASEVLEQILDFEMSSFRASYSYTGKYNEDAIKSALRAGLSDYLLHFHLYSTYEEIGKAFPAYYLAAPVM